MDVTVITPTIPTRDRMLMRARMSVARQTWLPDAHLIGIDYARIGGAAMRNKLWPTCDTKYVAVLDDDDWFHPSHLAVLVSAAEENGSDITYTWCDVQGRAGWSPNSHFDSARLRTESYIPSACLYDREMLEALGGWRDPNASVNGWPDYDLFLRALDTFPFHCEPVITWTYVFHGGNSTMQPGGEPDAH